jgi:hypothetical protein
VTTKPALRQCTHLKQGITSTYVERRGKRDCLDCVAEEYTRTRDASIAHIYYQVTEARSQR